MCGIYGIIFHKQPDAAYTDRVHACFNAMAVLAADRGLDSVGVGHILRDGRVSIWKDTIPSYRAIRKKAWNNIVRPLFAETTMLMGHTRKGTHGENTIVNAHPHQFPGPYGMLVGTHNGVIRNFEAFGPKETAFSNDSANLFFGLAQAALKDWNTLLYRIQGSYALAFSRGGVVYLCRNYGSPCHLGYLPELHATIYASTEHILRSGGALGGLSIKDVRSMDPGKLYSWKDGETTQVAYETYTSARFPHYDWEGYGGTGGSSSSSTSSASASTTTLATSKDGPDRRWCARCKMTKWFSYNRVVGGRAICDDCMKEFRLSNIEAMGILEQAQGQGV